jgi:nucleoid DNA-binding protein
MNLARRVSQRTGLSYADCNAILRAVAMEIADSLRRDAFIKFEGFGMFSYKYTSVKPRVRITPTEAFLKRLQPLPEEREDEIIFK